MSKFLIITNPSPAHMYPLYPIVSELVKSGHTVKWISGWAYKEKVEKTGAEYIQMHPKFDRGTTELYDFFPELKKLNGIAMLKFYYKNWLLSPVKYYVNQIEDVLVDFKADAIIGESFRLYAVFVTERGGPTFAMINVLPLIYPSKDVPPQGMGMLPGSSFFSKIKESILRFVLYKIIFRSSQKYCNQIRSNLGLPKYKHIFIKEGCDRSAVIMQPTVPSFEYYPQSKLPENVHFIGPILVKPDPSFVPPAWWEKIITGDKRVILVNQGTIAKNIDNLIKPSIKALENEDALVIAVSVKKNQLSNLPNNVFTSEFIPFGNLFPYVDVIITNGGYGGVQNALAHGIPLIIAGATEDKMEVSARVEYAQVGINLKTSNPTPDKILQAVNEVFSNPVYRENAEKYQSESKKYNAPKMAVKLLEEMVSNN
jgi:UDP:flavonoid glycosyltransferase YjiC (YdhE family)